MSETAASAHRWKFYRAGGVDQVVFRDGRDIAALPHLDPKLWLALAMPVSGTEFDPRTAKLLDTDQDGRIRPPEILAAVAWAEKAFVDLGDLMPGGDRVPLARIRDPEILASARLVLTALGKPEAEAISLADVSSREKILAGTPFNGDGILPPEAVDDLRLRAVVEQIVATVGFVQDLGGKPGVSRSLVETFFKQVEGWVAWADRAASDPEVLPLGRDRTAAAAAATGKVAGKIEDFFARCRLAAYDPRAAAVMNRRESDYAAVALSDLKTASPEVAAFPLALIEAGRPLPLAEGVNPAWADAIRAFATDAVAPLLGASREALTETEWADLRRRLAPYRAWADAKPETAVEKLGGDRLRELAEGGLKAAVLDLVARDEAQAPEVARLAAVEKLVRIQAHFFALLSNFVNFSRFYARQGAVFQAGTLYLDARACSLCLEVADPARHALLAGLANAYLAYCDLARGGLKRSIVAVITDGDSDNLMVGRNGVFYDSQGRDWDATITRVVSNPISVREAFWLPYKKLIRMIEEQIAKRALAAEAASSAKLETTATAVAAADLAPPPPATPAPAPPRKIDLGTIALIGTAIGGVSALVGGFLQALFGLGIWLPLGLLGVLLLISGPSMLLASLKLRARNLGPILDASGWAINTRARLNIPFGAALTELAKLPPGAERSLDDPFADKRRPWKTVTALLLAIVVGALWWNGRLDRWLHEALRRHPAEVPTEEAPADPETPAEAPPAPDPVEPAP